MNKAETQPGISLTPVTNNEDTAKSIRCPFAVVEKLVDLSVPVRRPARRTFRPDVDAELRKRAQDITPSNDALEKLAKQHPAPQEWFDEDGDE